MQAMRVAGTAVLSVGIHARTHIHASHLCAWLQDNIQTWLKAGVVGQYFAAEYYACTYRNRYRYRYSRVWESKALINPCQGLNADAVQEAVRVDSYTREARGRVHTPRCSICGRVRRGYGGAIAACDRSNGVNDITGAPLDCCDDIYSTRGACDRVAPHTAAGATNCANCVRANCDSLDD